MFRKIKSCLCESKEIKTIVKCQYRFILNNSFSSNKFIFIQFFFLIYKKGINVIRSCKIIKLNKN